MSVVSLTNVDMAAGSGRLFEEVTLSIEEGERIGLVGRNGSGKSTFLRIITGALEPDEGAVVHGRGLRVASLPQRPPRPAGLTVDEYLTSAETLAVPQSAGSPPPAAGVRIEQDTGPGSSVGMDPEALAEAQLRYRTVCTQLGMDQPEAPIATLSGGMLKKIALARSLAFESDLLTLDEPTNHLDLDTIVWLEQELQSMMQAFVMVTHDRAMLESVCTAILEIADGRIYRHEGNYSTYLRRRAERQEAADRAEERRVSILRRELEWLQRGPRARTSKDKGRKDRIDSLLAEGQQADAELEALPAAQRRLGKKVLELEGVAKSYDGVPVIGGFTHELTPGERVGIIGPNGSGKTTLLDIIAGRVAPDHGRVEAGETTVFAYFDQTARRLAPDKTVLEYITDQAERIRIDRETSVSAESFLERFLFPRSMHAQVLGSLSGGELRRLQLVRLLAGAPNVLLFDEPTNDLDVETLRILEQYLESFTGCILLVSHDRALLDRLTHSLWVFDGDGTITRFVGTYDEYRRRRLEGDVAAGAARGGGVAKGRAGERDRGKEARRAGERDRGKEARRAARTPRRGLTYREQQEYEALPDEVSALETELRELESHFSRASHDPEELEARTKRYHALREEIEQKTARWEELAERAEE